jgi:hypothetical protein
VRPESAFLEAVIIATCAVIAAVGAVVLVRAMSRSRSRLAQRRVDLIRVAGQVRRDATGLRAQMGHTIETVERMRADGASLGQDMGRLTDSLRVQRRGIERVTRGRLATVIRMADVISKAARFAFLWR